MLNQSIRKPLFGEDGIDFFDVRNQGLPGILLFSAFLTSMLTALRFMRFEKFDGTLERMNSTGISSMQIILAQLIVRTLFNFLSSFFTLLVAIYFYKVECNGSFYWVVVLFFLQNISGLAYGMIFATYCDNPIVYVIGVIGSTVVYLFFSGIVWPYDAQPYFFRPYSKFTPLTLPSITLRSLMIRGLPISSGLVWPGFAISLFYFILFLTAAVNFLNLKAL